MVTDYLHRLAYYVLLLIFWCSWQTAYLFYQKEFFFIISRSPLAYPRGCSYKKKTKRIVHLETIRLVFRYFTWQAAH